ncbi:hypothetical protein Tco_1260350, partial [Tanacetum coccineum]
SKMGDVDIDTFTIEQRMTLTRENQGPGMVKPDIDVKRVEEVKYGEFGRPFLNNGGNGSRYRVGPPGYYTCVDNRPPFGEKKASLEETINKGI